MDISDINFFPSQRTGYTISPEKNETSDINKTLEILIPDIVKISITIDNIRLGSNSNINQTLIFIGKSYFDPILGFFQSDLCTLSNMEGFIQLLPG